MEKNSLFQYGSFRDRKIIYSFSGYASCLPCNSCTVYQCSLFLKIFYLEFSSAFLYFSPNVVDLHWSDPSRTV